MNSGPLSGVRVVDLTRILAGPFCTMVLGDLGADVVKVEEATHGDDTRAWGPPFQGDQSAYFLSVNRNKRSIGLDLKSPEGSGIVRRLVERADVLVENFRPGAAERLGLGWEEMSRIRPELVYASISGYGQTGPDANRPGYDAIAQARSGIMSVTGEPDGPPVRVGVSSGDIGAGMWAAIGILAALHARESTGRGQLVDVSLLDGQVAWLTYVAAGYFASGSTPRRYGSAHPSIVPYQAVRSADGRVMLAVGNDTLWRKFAVAVGSPELADNPRYATNELRVCNREEVIRAIERVLVHEPTEHWVKVLEEAGVPAGPINDVPAAVRDPQILAREMVVEFVHPSAGTVRSVGSPIKLSDTTTSMRLAPPVLGEHGDAVLKEFGMSAREIEGLRERGVLT